eukprot:gene27386-33740_t
MESWKTVTEESEVSFDIAISIQYDLRIKRTERHFNLHTGLLPEFGGQDIIYHTLRLGKREQGLTFHKMEKALDEGGIICKGTYPVFPGDSTTDVYERMLRIAPGFLFSCMCVLVGMKSEDLPRLSVETPKRYRRHRDIDPSDEDAYRK